MPQHRTVRSTAKCCKALQSTTIQSTAKYCKALHCTALRWRAKHCKAQHCKAQCSTLRTTLQSKTNKALLQSKTNLKGKAKHCKALQTPAKHRKALHCKALQSKVPPSTAKQQSEGKQKAQPTQTAGLPPAPVSPHLHDALLGTRPPFSHGKGLCCLVRVMAAVSPWWSARHGGDQIVLWSGPGWQSTISHRASECGSNPGS